MAAGAKRSPSLADSQTHFGQKVAKTSCLQFHRGMPYSLFVDQIGIAGLIDISQPRLLFDRKNIFLINEITFT